MPEKAGHDVRPGWTLQLQHGKSRSFKRANQRGSATSEVIAWDDEPGGIVCAHVMRTRGYIWEPKERRIEADEGEGRQWWPSEESRLSLFEFRA